jgi:DNA-binding NarL/FixJ family response regulator
MAIDVVDLPSAAERLDDLSPREREVLSLVREGMSAREIAQRLALSESTVYRVIAELLDAVELEPPTITAADIHGRAGTRPATADEVAGFHSELGPFDTDGEG